MMWNSGKPSTDADELCLLDSGITSLRNVPLHKNLQVKVKNNTRLHCYFYFLYFVEMGMHTIMLVYT